MVVLPGASVRDGDTGRVADRAGMVGRSLAHATGQEKSGEGQCVYADTWFLSLDDARVLEVHIAETLGAGNT